MQSAVSSFSSPAIGGAGLGVTCSGQGKGTKTVATPAHAFWRALHAQAAWGEQQGWGGLAGPGMRFISAYFVNSG